MKTQSTFDQKTILTLLDVFGSCITDVFYNHLYDRAVLVHEKTSTGITECYRQAISDYVNECSSPRFYTVLLNSLHHYLRMSTIYNAISYPDCVTLYSSLFVPQMYIASLTAEQKMNILSMIIGKSIRTFADEIMQEYIGCIIDDHNDPVNVEVLQDSILKIILHERDVSYERFISSQKPQKKVPPSSATVRPRAMSKLTDAFKKSIAERVSLKKKNCHLIKKNKELVKQCSELKNMLLNQIIIQKDQSKIIDELKTRLCPSAPEQPVLEPKQIVVQEDEYNDDELFSVQYVES